MPAALLRLDTAIAEAEQAATIAIIDRSDREATARAAQQLLDACRSLRRLWRTIAPRIAAAPKLRRMRRGLDAGRRAAHETKLSERERKDARLRTAWKQYVAAGWEDEEILGVLAKRHQVQIATVRRRARRLKLLRDA